MLLCYTDTVIDMKIDCHTDLNQSKEVGFIYPSATKEDNRLCCTDLIERKEDNRLCYTYFSEIKEDNRLF